MPQWLKEYEQSPVKDNSEFPCVKKLCKKKKSTNLNQLEVLLIYIIML